MTDLESAAAEFEDRYGLASIEGGRHPGWGTANRIVPLGDSYLELIAVVDEDEASASAFGRWVGRSEPGRAMGWAIRTSDLAAIADRLDLLVDAGARERSDGVRLSWRLGGVREAAAEPSLPFFIEWGADTPFPGRAASGEVRIAELELRGSRERIEAWVGPAALPVVIADGDSAVAGVWLERVSGERFLVPEQ